MNEKGSKRRDWVKNVAIIFLTIMLILTFFSNTIMNYSLPEVAVQYVESASITAQIRGSGMVESDDPYKILINETRKIESVLVREGDTVQKGDILFTLADKESEELDQARKDLDAAVSAFELGLLNGSVSNTSIHNAETGNVSSVQTYLNRITAADNKIERLENEIEDLDRRITELSNQQKYLGYTTPDTSDEQLRVGNAQKALDADPVKKALDLIQEYENKIAEYQSTIDEYERGIITGWDVSGGDIYTVSEEDYQLALINKARYEQLIAEEKPITEDLEARAAYDAKVNELNSANEALEAETNSVTNSSNSISMQIDSLNMEQQDKQKQLNEANEDRTQLLTDIAAELNLSDQLDKINEMKENIKDLEEKSVGTVVEAPISGTMSSISLTAGQETTPGQEFATMLPEGSGFTMSFSVSNDQARKLNPGIQADLVNSWRYDNVTVTLASIRPDPNDPSQKKLLVFNVEGNVTAGQSISVAVGDRSANYDMVVPNSAIREDSNGKFVLIVESRATPLSTRYTATRVDVEVLASDDTRSAITGGLYPYDYVVTTSDKPVNAGQQIRLADN